MATVLLCRVFQVVDERLVQHVALFQESVAFSYLALDGLGLVLTVAFWRQAVGGNAVVYQVVDHAFGTSLRQPLVILR